ncbi:MAG TPA: 4Fe-4S dicluster domain-containing protein, partial [Rhabdochlamydiaceae bacterium]|nr:4Fe-4S dicluster domain-containing protein [Rhabdochlamydiaceae bacterium]
MICIHPEWPVTDDQIKTNQAWEVEKRRFEILGGKIAFAKPVSLTPKSPLIWEFRIQDEKGVRIIEVARVISMGPFREDEGVREHPPGSFLFELAQTAKESPDQDIEGWNLEEVRGRRLGAKIVKVLAQNLSLSKESRDRVEKILQLSKRNLKRLENSKENPFQFCYEGKWISKGNRNFVQSFAGVPQKTHLFKSVASLECFDDIPCNLCEQACPDSAIKIQREVSSDQVKTISFLNESKCTACGLCLVACPSRSALMIQETEDAGTAKLTFPKTSEQEWNKGDPVTLLNRRGESLGMGRVIGNPVPQLPLVQLEVPSHIAWEARGFKAIKKPADADEVVPDFYDQIRANLEKAEIFLNGEKRLAREGISVSMALFEMGKARSGDALLCPDGSCQLCEVVIDGAKKLACKTPIHKGMSIKLEAAVDQEQVYLCPCRKISAQTASDSLKPGRQSPEAMLSVTGVGEGRCHGQLCMGSFRRLLESKGIPVDDWVDWRFPSSDWVIS